MSTIADVIRRNARYRVDQAFLKFEEREWSHAQYFWECCRFAHMFLRELDLTRPPHIGILAENIPEYLFALGGAALSGTVLVGLNPTRRGEHLARDVTFTDCQIVIVEPKFHERLDGLDLGGARLLETGDLGSLDLALAYVSTEDPDVRVLPPDPWLLIFTSGTQDAPKACTCSHGRMVRTADKLAAIIGVRGDDTGYLAMPLFHSNAIMCAYLLALSKGAALGMARKFSVSRFLDDVRTYGATWFSYTGKPLAYLLTAPERPDDAANPLRVAYGNEGSTRTCEAFARRFGCRVIDAFGATEGGVGVRRQPGDPPGSLGRPDEGVKVLDPDGHDCPPARFDEAGGILNAEACVGEIVNTAGLGNFEGYYRNPEANALRTRNGWYWTGDLGYRDAEGYLYFAGRTADWIRVEGENFPAAPIERILERHPSVLLAAVYGVPDPEAGDQVMATLVPRGMLAVEGLAAWLDAQPDLGPKWRPRFVRVATEMPQTASGKVIARELRRQKWLSGDPLWWRERGDPAYRPFTADDAERLRKAFEASGRVHLLDL